MQLYIAGLQVRSAGSIAGNIFMTRDHADHGTPFPSDVYTILATLGTKVTIGSLEYTEGSKNFLLTEMPAVQDLPEDALILSFHLPLHTLHENMYRRIELPAECRWRTRL